MIEEHLILISEFYILDWWTLGINMGQNILLNLYLFFCFLDTVQFNYLVLCSSSISRQVLRCFASSWNYLNRVFLETLGLFVLRIIIFTLRKNLDVILNFQCIFLFNIFIKLPILIWNFIKYLGDVFTCCLLGSLFTNHLCFRNIFLIFYSGYMFIGHVSY